MIHQLDNKNAILDRTQETLTNMLETVDKLQCEVDILTEERNVLTSELQKNICDNGNSSNEVYEVLRLRDKMAKEFVAYRFDSQEAIEMLEERIQQKDELIDKVRKKINKVFPSYGTLEGPLRYQWLPGVVGLQNMHSC